MPPELRVPTLMITTPIRPIHKPEDLKLYKTLPASPETKKTVVTMSPRLRSVSGAEPSVKINSLVKPVPLITVASEQNEFENFVKNNLKGLNSNVKQDRLKKMMECYRDDFYRHVPYTPMQTEHNFYDYLVKRHFPELMHYLGVTNIAPKNFPIKKDNLEYYLKIERTILPLARALGFKELESFKKSLEFSSFQKGFGNYLTNLNSAADQKIVFILTKGKEVPLSFRSAPTDEIYKPTLPPLSNDKLSTQEERLALLYYIENYFVGKNKESVVKEIKSTTDAVKLHLLWEQFMSSVERRAQVDGKQTYLYFEPVVCGRISSKAGWRRDPLRSRRRKIVLNFHKGTDLPASEGTKIFNPYPGKVIWVSHDEDTGAGKTIHIQHKNGLITRYKHLSKINVSVDDEVPLGRVVAESGDTGHRTTGPHLHYEIIDPEKEYSYRFSAKVKNLVGYRYKKVKRNGKYVKLKRPVYQTATIRRNSTAHIAPINKKTLFVHTRTRLSLKQLITNAEKKYAERLQRLLALN